MVNIGDAVTLGGHKTVRISSSSRGSWEYKCNDCGTRGNPALYTAGIDGCPGRPESLNMLRVCGGGNLCGGHMAQDSPEWRAWKESSSTSSDQVPRTTCGSDHVGERVRTQFLHYAKRLGMRLDDWKVCGNGAGKVATFTHDKGAYELWAGETGMVTPLQVGK